MANFRTHITTSTVLGFGVTGIGLWADSIPVDSAMIAGGLCGVSGMLPDLDSGSGIPLRETMSFAAAVIPLLLLDRMQHLGLSYESMVLAGGSIYLFIRFGVAKFLSKYTVHRGMFHSIPAALIFAGLGFLICGCSDISLRYFKAGAVFVGFMSHLFLDEIYAMEIKGGRFRFKKSFGTAIKVWGSSLWGNVSVYAKLVAVALLIGGEATFMEHYGTEDPLATAKERLHNHTSHSPTEHAHDGNQPKSNDQSVYDTATRIWDKITK